MVDLRPVVAGRERTLCCHSAVFSGDYLPNSLAAVEDCARNGVARLEVDVRFLSDDSLLLYHGTELDGETTGSGNVRDLDRAAARAVNYSNEIASPLCFLEDVVELLRPTDSLLQVDLKLMRPISDRRLDILCEALRPLGDRALIGSQAHWNLRPLAKRGHAVGFDPTVQWHFSPEREHGYFPDTLGVYGMWDDAAIAHHRTFAPRQYFETRTADILGLLPEAVEWMVDIGTVRHMADMGFALGHELAERGVNLAAWTLRDAGPQQTMAALVAVCDAGAGTVITADPVAVLGYLGADGL